MFPETVQQNNIDDILAKYAERESSLVMILQDIQARFGYLPKDVLERVAKRLGVSPAEVFSIATFYRVFSLEPQGRTLIQVCKGTACHVRGAQLVEDELCRQLDVPVGGTTIDRAFTLKTVNCVGACAMAPVVITGDSYHPDVKPSGISRLLKKVEPTESPKAPAKERAPVVPFLVSVASLKSRSEEARTRATKGRIRVCGGPGCLAAGAESVLTALNKAAAKQGLPVQAELADCSETDHLLDLTGCQGLCQQGPLVWLQPTDTLYTHVKANDAPEIIKAIGDGTIVQRLTGESPTRGEHPFYQGQTLRALSHCGQTSPTSLYDYLAAGGFGALSKALTELSPDEVISAVETSGLRGRGGAGFPTGRKWRSALKAAGEVGCSPYLLCNGDEGDPGAFMDRAIMEGAPLQVIEGMILGAYATGATEGFIYVRAEYPLAVLRLEHAIAQCHAAGLLGQNILGTYFSFDIEISRGGGAFVCGESTALMRSIEGKVGEPRAKYVRSVERGLHDKPTVLNNVESWALIPGVISHGPQWLNTMGTARSKGTKAFSLVGQVKRTGLVEVPMGTTLRELIFDVGGGMREGSVFKAVQSGGPSGWCLPERCLGLPIDFDALEEAGSMMGSGGMIVMDQHTCMVDVARYFVDFLQEESCGKCVPCRLGLPQLSHLLGKVTRGDGTADDLQSIMEIGQGMTDNSLCGLGKSAANPVISTLRYFREEYEEHLHGRCPAGVCRELIHYEITNDCTGCLLCLKACPEKAITGDKKEKHVIDQSLCTKCGICRSICDKYDAVAVIPGGAR